MSSVFVRFCDVAELIQIADIAKLNDNGSRGWGSWKNMKKEMRKRDMELNKRHVVGVA